MVTAAASLYLVTTAACLCMLTAAFIWTVTAACLYMAMVACLWTVSATACLPPLKIEGDPRRFGFHWFLSIRTCLVPNFCSRTQAFQYRSLQTFKENSYCMLSFRAMNHVLQVAPPGNSALNLLLKSTVPRRACTSMCLLLVSTHHLSYPLIPFFHASLLPQQSRASPWAAACCCLPR